MFRRSPWTLVALLVGAGVYGSTLRPARAAPDAPEVRVRARPLLAEVFAESRGRTVQVEGQLRDDLGSPVSGVRVSVRLGERGPEVEWVTGPNGGFEGRLTATAEGVQSVLVEYAGNALLAPTRTALRVDVGRAQVNLALDAPSEVDGDAPSTIPLLATDRRGRPLEGVEVHLELDDTPVVTARTDASGTALFGLERLSPGVHRLRARTPGDDERLPAEVTRTLLSLRSPTLEVKTVAPPAAGAGRKGLLEVEGRTFGPERRDTRLALLLDGRVAARTTPEPDGTFAFAVPREALPAVSVRVEVEVRAVSEGWRPVRSPAQTLALPPLPAPSTGLALYWPQLGAGLAAVVALMTLFGMRRTPPAAQPAARAAEPPPFEFRPGPRRSGEPVRLTVRVLDAVSSQPVTATLRWHKGADTVATDAEGRAVLTGPGGEVLEVLARGYAPFERPCAAPTGGEVVVRLLPFRAAVQRRFEHWLGALAPPRPTFGRESLAEIAEALVARGCSADRVAALVAAVEVACFDAPTPGADALAQIELRLRDVATEVA